MLSLKYAPLSASKRSSSCSSRLNACTKGTVERTSVTLLAISSCFFRCFLDEDLAAR